MLTYHSRFLTRGEVWFDEEPDHTPVDWIYHRQRSSPTAHGHWKYFYTVLTDLDKSPGRLLDDMDKKTAQKILEGRDGDRLQWERHDGKDPRIMDHVERLWNEFATAQKTPRFEREWMDQFARAGSLHLSAARDTAGDVLAYHLVFLTPKRARQLIAISPYRAAPDVAWRNAVSRANCFIHWMNFLDFKSRGITCFDFGGWYPGTTNIRFLGINRFKLSFGGDVVREYDCEQPVTAKGRLALAAARILQRARDLRKSKPAPETPEVPPPRTRKDNHATTKNCDVSPAI